MTSHTGRHVNWLSCGWISQLGLLARKGHHVSGNVVDVLLKHILFSAKHCRDGGSLWWHHRCEIARALCSMLNHVGHMLLSTKLNQVGSQTILTFSGVAMAGDTVCVEQRFPHCQHGGFICVGPLIIKLRFVGTHFFIILLCLGPIPNGKAHHHIPKGKADHGDHDQVQSEGCGIESFRDAVEGVVSLMDMRIFAHSVLDEIDQYGHCRHGQNRGNQSDLRCRVIKQCPHHLLLADWTGCADGSICSLGSKGSSVKMSVPRLSILLPISLEP